MSGYLLDTVSLSEVIRKQPDPEFMGRLDTVPTGDLHTSAVCVMELRHGAGRVSHGHRLWERIQHEVLTNVTIAPFTENEALRAAEILAQLESAGTPIGVEDTLIGTTALSHDFTVITRNVRHFTPIPGLDVESWWGEA